MEIYLRYGDTFQKVDLPSSSHIYVAKGFISKRQAKLEEILLNSLNKPIGTDPLEKIASSGSRVALIVDDITRPTPTKSLLPLVIGRLLKRGVNKDDISIVMAIGAHRKGVEIIRALFETSIDEEVDIAIWAFGPGDDNLWDVLSGKFIGAQKRILKNGGTLILVAECPNGLYKYGRGHIDYSGKVADYSRVIEMLRSGVSPDEIISETLRGNMPYMEAGVKAYIISMLIRRSNIIVVSHNLREEDVKWLGSIAKTADEAVSQAIQLEGRDARIAVVPETYVSDGYIFRRT